MIKEVFRTLKPGAYFRVIVPDVRKYIDFYQGNYNPNELLERYKNPIEGLRALSQNWHHTSLWDASLMQAFLEDVGFVEVRECKAFEGTDEKLIKDNPDAVFESLYIEAKKP